jgi:aconitate hydratase
MTAANQIVRSAKKVLAMEGRPHMTTSPVSSSQSTLSKAMRPDAEIALKIDQFLLHDGTGPLCALQLEAMGVEQVCAETVVAYVDHLLVEADSKNADDHILLHSAARRFGMWFSRAGDGTSHPVHQQRFGIPGKTLLGADP